MNLVDNDFIIHIPARADNKRNIDRKLLPYTLNSIPPEYLDKVYVNTNDEEIVKTCKEYGIKVHTRSIRCSGDYVSMKDVLYEFILDKKIRKTIITLYLTYPERTWEDIVTIYNFYKQNKGRSLLCKKEVKQHPYLMMIEKGELFGEPIIKHNLYRKQDYPKVFEICHYVSIVEPSSFRNLSPNLYNLQTIYYPIKEKVVDDYEILEKIQNSEYVEEIIHEKKNIEKDIYEKIEKKLVNNILILGNDKTLCELDIEKAKERYSYIIGINRSWMKFETDYLFFQDIEILLELIESGKDLSKMNLVSTDYLEYNAKISGKLHIFNKYKQYIDIYNRDDKEFPDSVTNAIKVFNNKIFTETENIFHLYAVSLKFDNEKNHFWSGQRNILNKYDESYEWYSKRFDIIFNVIKNMVDRGYKIISVSKNSRLNDILEYKEIYS